MVNKVISIGDSFLYGLELSDCNNGQASQLTWPALYAQHIGAEYTCLAQPGHSCQYVLRTLLDSLQVEQNCFYIILWPSSIRHEYYNKENNQWTQLTPNIILNQTDTSDLVCKTHYSSVNSLLGDKWQNLLNIYAATQALKNSNNFFSMSVISDFIFETEFFNPPYITFLQEKTRNYITQFDGLDFYTWAKQQNFSCGPGGHPLEEAHQNAYKYLKLIYKGILCGS